MFLSQERETSRKPFQKPNILRRKSKVGKLNATKRNEPSERVSPETGLIGENARQALPSARTEQVTFVPTQKTDEIEVNEISGENSSQTLEINGDSITIYAHNTQSESTEPCIVQSTLNVESFLNNGIVKQNDNILFNIDATIAPTKTQNEHQKWSLHFMTEDDNDNAANYYDGSQISNIYSDRTSDASAREAAESLTVSQLDGQNIVSQDVSNGQTIALDCYNTKAIKFKCDEPNCDKSFWTEARLEKHKRGHDKQNSATPTVIECPVKKTGEDGEVITCGRTFLVRTQLMKHLNDDHSPEDAVYRCAKCGRGFYHAAGARAHAVRRSCTRAFACAWAGCGRVFRQPCRLREHARAHTGDRPYSCPYPNCGWAFRSASKLMRHERRHTGERRHKCAACWRAFPRREHLRDHIARHHTPLAAAGDATDDGVAIDSTTVAPTDTDHLGNEETYKSVTNGPQQLSNVKSKNGKKQATKKPPKSKAKKNMFVVPLAEMPSAKFEASETVKSEGSLQEKDRDEERVIQDDVLESGEERCARTHCTWPLQRSQDHYTLEDDTQVEQSESSESNIYTVRSDLFLHGNLLINEDSEFIISRGGEGAGEEGAGGEGAGRAGAGAGGALDAALGLIDSHPTIDLMQEELMYADAVDESSFRVLLLNGEELA